MRKYLLIAMAMAAILCASAAYADSDGIRKIGYLENRGLGGADLALDEHILSNEAWVEGWKFHIFGLESIGNFTKAKEAYSLFKDMFCCKDDLTIITAVRERNPVDFASRARVEPFRVSWGTKDFGRLTVGVYGEGDLAIRNYNLNTNSLPRGGEGLNSYVDFEGTPDLAAMLFRADVGGLIGYTRVFRLPKPSNFHLLVPEIGAGVQVRILRRWLTPKTAIRINGKMSLPNMSDSLQAPDFQQKVGDGFAVDLFATLALNDPVIDAKIAFTAENFGQVWYGTKVVREEPRCSVGGLVSPLYSIGHDRWKISADLEDLQDGLTWQIGTLYTLGNDRFSFSPSVGYIYGERDLFNRQSDFFTTGLMVKLSGFKLFAVYEFNISLAIYSVGAGVGMTF